jgi:hypothetical protein
MTTLPLDPTHPVQRALRQLVTLAGAVLAVALVALRTKTRPTLAHLRDHAYGILGLGCIDAAAFVHSVFTGLLVTGVSFLIFEWKVQQQ